ncbi:DUF2490 domain-containing protein [Ferruginibacter yonginensis]|uniref:DUF2490 domain-containing protein n=1 Tax=Ferruginibacter yonginensis TaxID=1310416 RepID=A0ABV8QRR3_9BACT
MIFFKTSFFSQKLWTACMVFLMCCSLSLQAQKKALGSWNVLNMRYNFNYKWSGFAEAQLRSLKFYNDFNYYEFKSAIQYKINDQVNVGLGLGTYQTYTTGGNFKTPKVNNEQRIWPQLLLNNGIGRIKIEQRFRTELRFTSNGYRNRFRYRVGAIYPFGKFKNNDQPLSFNVSTEIFLNNKAAYFERNRFLATFNYKQSNSVTYVIGYVSQFDYSLIRQSTQNYIQVGCFFDLSKYLLRHTFSSYEINEN